MPALWHALSISATVDQLKTDSERGLAAAEAGARLATYGPNRATAVRSEPWWVELLEELREPMVVLLLAVAAGYFLLGERRDALVVLAITVGILGIEVVSESRAKRAIGALRVLGSPVVQALRDGAAVELRPEQLVPGDLVLLHPGERVPADLRLIESNGLRIDESVLTGESVAVTKQAAQTVDPDTGLGDRIDVAFAGSLVVGGKGRGVVVATGQSTEIGRIGRLIAEAREPRTPLQTEMGRLARSLGWVALAVSVTVPVAALALGGVTAQDALLAGLTLAFATIPEELPILITVVLALGALQLSRRQAFVKRLVAAETLGAVTVICTDKTGTLTRNQMQVQIAWLSGERVEPDRLQAHPLGRRMLEAAVRANDAAAIHQNGRIAFIGDPTEIALLAAAQLAGADVLGLTRGLEVVEEWPFDEQRKRMTVLYRADGGLRLAMKGAVESVLAVATRIETAHGSIDAGDAEREWILSNAQQLAAEGLRVLAVADRAPLEQGEPRGEEGVTFLGLLALQDPPRPEAKAAIAEVRAAGIRVLILTGDHPATASAIAAQVGLDGAWPVVGGELDGMSNADLRRALRTSTVFARITPEHKLRIVRILQDGGDIVGVTGDGVNDAPALKQAAIGIAMGRTGSDVAKEVADLVLGDDNFATVAVAVREGRRLYANLRKAVGFYLAAKIAIVIASVVAVLTRAPLPFAPIQLILLEAFMDLFASITFTTEPAEPDVMRERPRGLRRRFLDRALIRSILTGSITLGVAVSASYLLAWVGSADQRYAQTSAFATWMVGHVALALVMRTRRPIAGLLSNTPYLVWALVAMGVVAASQAVPAVGDLLHAAALQPRDLLAALVLGIALPLAGAVLGAVSTRADGRRSGSELTRRLKVGEQVEAVSDDRSRREGCSRRG